MRTADRSLDVVAFVTEHFRDILRRRLSELTGLALITLALLGAIALATWSVQDPSLSHATQTPIHNLLGFPGAIFSDLATQLLGLAAILLLILCFTSLAVQLLPELVARLFPNGIAWWMPLAGIGPFVLYELGARAFLTWRIAHGKDFPQPARFANALIETSLPGVIIFVLARHMEPQLVFGFWPPMLYFVFIVLSTLRLDFWLSKRIHILIY